MPSTPPSAANGYAIPLDQKATREFFELVFGSIHGRLFDLELTRADYAAAIDAITTQALAIVSSTISDEIVDQRAVLAQVRVAIDALLAEYEAVTTVGLPANRTRLAAIQGFDPLNVQDAIVALLTILGTKASDDAVMTALATKLAKAGGRLTGPLSPRVVDHGTKGSVTEAFKFGDGNVHTVRVAGSLVIDPQDLTEGDVLQVNALYQSGSIAVSGTTQWEVGGGVKSNNPADLGITLIAGSAYRLVFEIVAGVRTGVFQ